ncbi:nucleoside hydrolase [Flexithrix dorotheae]|uniref:nucleoside hydrolase n=1 Tax=Flexithrix dorotheae TaxID=70993 RepID=UPI00037AB1EA|nr:nucleoside hydrolase [Flexithrix dorotheae]
MKKILPILIHVFLFLSFSQAFAQKQKVIFDCDLGDDVDDAYALAMLMASPDLEVLGIVMDYGNTEKRAQMACRFLYEIGREDVPVVIGRNTKEHYSGQFHWGEGFDKVKPIKQNAADFIIETLKKYPNEVVLITVGPVPNMADIIEKDPKALGLAKKVYSMFGSFYVGYGDNPIPTNEWNVKADAEAAKVFAASGADIVYAGLDITNVKLSQELREKLLLRQSPLTDFLSACYTLWGNETPTLFDPVAIGMLIWPDLFATRPAHVKVIGNGYTVIDESKEPNSLVGMSINKKEFLNRLMKLYLEQNFNRF